MPTLTRPATPPLPMSSDPTVRARLRAAMRLLNIEERVAATREAVEELVTFLLDADQRPTLDQSADLARRLDAMRAIDLPRTPGDVPAFEKRPPLPEGTPSCVIYAWCARPSGHAGRCIGPIEQATNDGSVGTGPDRNRTDAAAMSNVPRLTRALADLDGRLEDMEAWLHTVAACVAGRNA